MALVSNNLQALYGGVNQQSAEHRLDTQVEEMINAYPTLDKGLLKRNPSRKIDLSSSITYNVDMWSYAYDRGLAGDDTEKYVINIYNGEMEIINVGDGTVYKDFNGLTYEGNSKEYIANSNGVNGFAATTVKDTTFIVNKNEIPVLDGTDVTETPETYNNITINLLPFTQDKAPHTNKKEVINTIGTQDITLDKIYPAYTTIIIDGITIKVDSIHGISKTCGIYSGFICIEWIENPTIIYSSYTSKIFSALADGLGEGYSVTFNDVDKIVVTKMDTQSAITGTYDITSDNPIDKLEYISSMDVGTQQGTIRLEDTRYLRNGYVWIEAANPSAAYTYSVTIEDETGTGAGIEYSASATTTTEAATLLADDIAAGGLFTAKASGSLVQITSNLTLKSVDSSDTYGDQASSSWTYKVQYTTDLPKNVGFDNVVVNVIGNADNTFASFWLKYEDSSWVETKDPKITKIINAETMPHILVRNSDGSFTFKEYDKWKSMLVGDDISNPDPSFIGRTIKDIFFMKNRLSFVTRNGAVLSEIGEYGNFFRTTTATVLDSDYIDAIVDTNTVISIEYAVFLQDTVMLFADKAQFRLSGGKVLSPKDVQISKASAYDMNMNVRPIYMNDKIFFCSTRGVYTSVMEYKVSQNNDTVESIDITAHVQSYIPSDITRLSGNSTGNMLFLTSSGIKNTVYIYKYYDNGATRVQAAWFKWMFNGDIYSGFSLGKNFNMLINRKDSSIETDWVVGSGIWDNSKKWDNSKLWVMSPDSLTSVNQFEVVPIDPIEYTGVFVDDAGSDNETIVSTLISLGEWVYSGGTKGKDIRGHLKMKTALITSEAGSDFYITVEDVARNSTREIKSKYTVGRKPMIYGDATNIRLHIANSSNTGFRINSISLEGALTKRDKKTN